MIKIIPFKATRPTRDKASLIPTKPYYTYKKKILNAILEANPYSFLHVINPEFKSKIKTAPNSIERFTHVREKYDSFIDKAYFTSDTKNSLYLYRQQGSEGSFTGLIAGASVADYLDGKIKVHEKTITRREETFASYLDVCQFNAEPVLLTYKGNNHIQNILNKYLDLRPEYEFTTMDQITHHLWVINDSSDILLLQKLFEDINEVYIADGHHRTASSVRYAKSHPEKAAAQHFLAYFIEEKEIKIYPFNRLVNTMNGHSTQSFLSSLSLEFKIEELRKNREISGNEFKLFIDKKWHLLTPKPDSFDNCHPVKSLMADVLSENILNKILGISDLKTDDRVSFVPGTLGDKELEKSVKNELSMMAFSLPAVKIEQLKLVADTQNIMPPKSTWIEPKMRSGLTIYNY